VAGEKRFEPGLLARAHRGFLYIDEVNLLEDHLVDLLLDVAASGVNVVEREGLSVRHPSRFVLVGSGNPEEGELRPQLLDRFGLMVEVASPNTVKERVEVVRRREAYERNPSDFIAAHEKAEAKLRRRIVKAQESVADVTAPDPVLEFSAMLCMRLGVDGLRGELTLIRAARARAALDGRAIATRDDVVAVAPMALRHRLRRDPLDEAGSAARVERVLMDVGDDAILNS
jgi:magnesium chelatase subunit I